MNPYVAILLAANRWQQIGYLLLMVEKIEPQVNLVSTKKPQLLNERSEATQRVTSSKRLLLQQPMHGQPAEVTLPQLLPMRRMVVATP